MENLIQSIRNQKHDSTSLLTNRLGFEDVTFAYDDTQLVFKNANFDFSNNGLILFKGSNGSGKTTIIKLLTNFISSNSGKVICETNGSIIGYSSANGNDIFAYKVISEICKHPIKHPLSFC